jgi:hypothetical protein
VFGRGRRSSGTSDLLDLDANSLHGGQRGKSVSGIHPGCG